MDEAIRILVKIKGEQPPHSAAQGVLKDAIRQIQAAKRKRECAS